MPARIQDCRPERTTRPAGSRGAFTLIEVMVAVGAIALVAVGLAAIFDAVGKTVSGGRRASTLNSYAALLESQLRRDFDAMTRDGFLVIRQNWTDGAANGTPDGTFDPDDVSDAVQLYPEDPAPRGRRMDEILFFARTAAKDGFRSKAQPIVPGLGVTSDSAMIYIGHGQRGREGSGLSFATPTLDDLNADPLAMLGRVDPPGTPPEFRNPNRYASEWILVRKATLLVPSATTLPFDIATVPPLNLRPEAVANKDAQVSLLPASPSIFRSYNRAFPLDVPTTQTHVRSMEGASTGPMLSSGLVDIATTDLAEIRQIVVGSIGPSGSDGLPRDIVRDSAMPLPPTGRFATTPIADPAPNQRPGTPTALDRQHAWMADAMPTQSDPLPDLRNDYPAPAGVDPRGVRLRCEPQAINLLASLAAPTAIETITRRGDQMMLTASNLIPRCSEFVVEWSFGQVEFGEIRWYGPDRRLADTNGDGVIDVNDAPSATTYPNVNSPLAEPRVVIPYTTNDGSVYDHFVSQQLIYGRRVLGTDAAVTSYFGYVDPTFTADTAPGDQDGDGNPLNDPGDARIGGVFWVWPKLIRVTVTLADPVDPRIESTFQYIFKVPTQ